MLTLLAFLSFLSTCFGHFRLHHYTETGPYDELNSMEIYKSYKNLAKFLGQQFTQSHFFQPFNNGSIFLPLINRTRVLHIALEVPPKRLRGTNAFPRIARIALFTPGDEFVHEYLVPTMKGNANVIEVRQIPALKRPVDEIEGSHLDYFLKEVCSGEFGEFLQEYYGGSYMYFSGNNNDLPTCMQSARLSDNETPPSFTSCLFGMFASPRVMTDRPHRRRTIFRLNRFAPPYNQHPTDVNIEIDHTEGEQSQWQVSGVNIQGHAYDNLNAFLSIKSNWSKIFIKKMYHTNPFKASHTNGRGSNLCPRRRSINKTEPVYDTFKGQVRNKHVSYGPWSFDLGVRHESGLRFYNIRFNNKTIIREVGMDETVTSYGGETPFMRSLVSVESMFGFGSLTSELAPGIDCPVDAVYLSVPVIPSLTGGARTIHNGICIYTSAANVHNGPMRRHYQLFEEDSSLPNSGYGTGVFEESLYVVTQVAAFNYQYAFVNIFSPMGSYSCYVAPSGYIHVDVPKGNENLYGYVMPQLNLRFSIHTHHFLFFVDALGGSNTVQQTQVYAEDEKSQFDRMNMEERRLLNEGEARVKGNNPTIKTALCEAEDTTKCLEVINFSPMHSMVSINSSHSFSWIRNAIWFTKYKESELRGSSIYNGVDLTDPVVDFARFSNNETLNGDVTMWINVGLIHIPVKEDIPHTPSKGSQVGFMLKPHNLFDQTPDSFASQGYVFTRSKEEWINGYVNPLHYDCENTPTDSTFTKV